MEGTVSGPESIVVDNGKIYTGTRDGWVFEILPSGKYRRLRRLNYDHCQGRMVNEAICGRPLGMRMDKDKNLIVLDAYKGIFKINPKNRQMQWLMNAKNVNGKGFHVHFLNDVTISKSGLIFFTSSSDVHSRAEYMKIILEGDKTGRVLVYNPNAPPEERVSVVMRNLHFPNGIQLSKDESYLLVAEGARSKIHRIWLKGNQKDQLTTFADDLPGFIDNIRLSPRGTYWVALSSARYHGKPSVLDLYGPKPRVRQLILSMPLRDILARAPKYGIVVELNEQGQILRSLHDPTGKLFDAVSEVQEENGILFFGSFKNNFIGVDNLKHVTPAIKPPSEPVDPPPIVPITTNPHVNFLNHVRAAIFNMSKERLRDIILTLIRRFLEARLDAQRAVERANRLQQQLNFATNVGSSGTTGMSLNVEFSGTTTAATSE